MLLYILRIIFFNKFSHLAATPVIGISNEIRFFIEDTLSPLEPYEINNPFDCKIASIR